MTPSTTRIALCSDTHFWPASTQRFGSDQNQLQPWSDQLLETLLSEIRAVSPDLVFHLGDLTCGGGSFNMPDDVFYQTVDTLYDAFNALSADFHILPGNHDCPAGQDWAYAETRFGLEPGLGHTIDLPMARLIMLNAQGHTPAQITEKADYGDPTYGWVSEAELARLDDALASAGDRPALVFVHQLLKPWPSDDYPWADLYGTQNAATVLDVLTRYGNVRAVFQAHAHMLNAQQAQLGDQNCWFIIQPAIIEYPLAWLQLDLSADQLHVSMKQLPLPDLAAVSLEQGEDRAWRAGQADWRSFTIELS